MRRTLLLSALTLAVSGVQPLSAAPSAGDIPPPGATGMVQQRAGGERFIDMHATLGQLSRSTLAKGREVYADLQHARRAAQRRDLIDTRLALGDATRVLDHFHEPAAARALRRQAALIRDDLAEEGAKPQPGLWLPLEAELNDATIQMPAEHRARARQAIEAGRAAAAAGDRETARQQVTLLEDVLDYRWGLLPLSKTRGDIQSARMALRPNPAYWKGVTEALDSALASVRWVTVAHAAGWFDAYEAAVDARFLLPAHARQAQQALTRAAGKLEGMPGAGLLAREAHELAQQPAPRVESVEALVQGLRAGLPNLEQTG